MTILNNDENDFETENYVSVVYDKLEDPIIDKHKLYPVSKILFLTLAASLVGVRSWRGAETFGIEMLEWLRDFLLFEEGIPPCHGEGRGFESPFPAPKTSTVMLGFFILYFHNIASIIADIYKLGCFFIFCYEANKERLQSG